MVVESLSEFLDSAERGHKITTRTVKLCLEPRSYSASDIKQIRSSLNVSQAVFARLLAVSLKLVQAWESSANQPKPWACRVFDEIALDPPTWLGRQLQMYGTTRKTRKAAS